MNLLPSVFIPDQDLTSMASELSDDYDFWTGQSKIMTDYPLMLVLDGSKRGHSVKEIRHSIVFASLELRIDLDNNRVHVTQGQRTASSQVEEAAHIRQYYAENYGILNKDRLGRTVSCRYQFIRDDHSQVRRHNNGTSQC